MPDQVGANYPAPRRDCVFDTEGPVMIIFGGWTGLSTSHMNDAWFFRPSNLQGNPILPNSFANAFFQLPATPGLGNALPAPRAASAHGVYGDNLVIYGGWTDGTGNPNSDPVLRDMWFLHLPSQMVRAQAGGKAGLWATKECVRAGRLLCSRRVRAEISALRKAA